MPKSHFLLLVLLFTTVVSTPLQRQQRQQTPPDVEPDAELLPTGPSPSLIVTPPPVASPVPSVQPGTSPEGSPATTPATTPAISPAVPPAVSPTASPGADTTPAASPTVSPPAGERPLPPGVIPGVIPGDTDGDGVQDDFDGDGEPDEPISTPEVVGKDSNRAALAGGLTGGIFALILLLLCIFCLFGRKKKEEPSEAVTGTGTGVYTSTDAGVASGDRDSTGTGGVLEKDDARDAGPAIPTGAGLAAGPVVAAVPSEEDSLEAIPRGPTPPPHDYVLGAGPAETRAAFVDLRTKFERDEIGDNSAVLGAERTGVVGEGLEMDISKPATEGTGETAASASTALPHETRKVPDRGEVPVTFESQERLMAGGDGSGAISDAAMSLTAASIAEESGDVPSLERDPIVRERDETF